MIIAMKDKIDENAVKYLIIKTADTAIKAIRGINPHTDITHEKIKGDIEYGIGVLVGAIMADNTLNESYYYTGELAIFIKRGLMGILELEVFLRLGNR